MNKSTLTKIAALSAAAVFSTQAAFAFQEMGGSTMNMGQGMEMDDSSMNMWSGWGQQTNAGPARTMNRSSSTTSAVGVSAPIDSHRFADQDAFEVMESIDDSNIDTEGNLWTESDVSLGNADHKGDLAVIGDLDVGNAEIDGNVYVRGKFTLGNGTVTGNVIVEGDFEAGNGEVGGYVFVTGNLNAGNTDFQGPVYVYGKKSELDNGDSGKKLKVAGALSSGNMNRTGAVYVFGKKAIHNATGRAVTIKGFLGKIDPFLQIDISEEDLAEVKAIALKYESDVKGIKASLASEIKVYKAAIKAKQSPTNVEKIEALKADLLALVPKAFEELAPFVEGMDFDMKSMSSLQTKELSMLKKEAAKFAVKK